MERSVKADLLEPGDKIKIEDPDNEAGPVLCTVDYVDSKRSTHYFTIVNTKEYEFPWAVPRHATVLRIEGN